MDSSEQRLPQEKEEGHIEYKWKLLAPDNERMQHLLTQMLWRLEEGNGRCFYEIGVSDNGELTGLRLLSCVCMSHVGVVMLCFFHFRIF